MPRLYSALVKETAIRLRRQNGKTFKEIASELGISVNTAFLWTRAIKPTEKQKHSIERRRNRRKMNVRERAEISVRLKPYRTKYTDEQLIQRIKDFYESNGRIPLKREFNAWSIYRSRFGGWNSAVRLAGFDTNPELFAKKFTANDGHLCDSFSEKLIDDWLLAQGVAHERSRRYEGTKYTADFYIEPDILIEFFGLAGVKRQYDRILRKKRVLSRKAGLVLIELYPKDLYPINRLPKLIPIRKGASQASCAPLPRASPL